MQHLTIRTVEDLYQLSGDELSACLRDLRRFILARRRRHAAALRDGSIAAGSTPDCSSFQWHPKRTSQLDCLSSLGLDMAIDAPTLSALRDALASVGLAFRPDADAQGPAADRWRVVLALHREARRRALRGLEDGAHPA